MASLKRRKHVYLRYVTIACRMIMTTMTKIITMKIFDNYNDDSYNDNDGEKYDGGNNDNDNDDDDIDNNNNNNNTRKM